MAENVKGLIIGNAKGYVKQIFREFNEAGYETQLFLLNAAAMGVPPFMMQRVSNEIAKQLFEKNI